MPICAGKIELRGRWPKQYWKDFQSDHPRLYRLVLGYLRGGWSVTNCKRDRGSITLTLALTTYREGKPETWERIERTMRLGNLTRKKHTICFGQPLVMRARSGEVERLVRGEWVA
ncbi:MAG: hypothetical protein AAGH78_00770 [Cyanobacteria bacterium P01_H01_bin.58]